MLYKAVVHQPKVCTQMKPEKSGVVNLKRYTLICSLLGIALDHPSLPHELNFSSCLHYYQGSPYLYVDENQSVAKVSQNKSRRKKTAKTAELYKLYYRTGQLTVRSTVHLYYTLCFTYVQEKDSSWVTTRMEATISALKLEFYQYDFFSQTRGYINIYKIQMIGT